MKVNWLKMHASPRGVDVPGPECSAPLDTKKLESLELLIDSISQRSLNLAIDRIDKTKEDGHNRYIY